MNNINTNSIIFIMKKNYLTKLYEKKQMSIDQNTQSFL